MEKETEAIQTLSNRVNELEQVIGISPENSSTLTTRIQNIVSQFNAVIDISDIKDFLESYDKISPFLEINFSEKMQSEHTSFMDRKQFIIDSEKLLNKYTEQYQVISDAKAIIDQGNFDNLDEIDKQLTEVEASFATLETEAKLIHQETIDKIKSYSDIINLLNGKLLSYLSALEKYESKNH
ncbi:hypothetical protein WA158_007396 [Blastocystis sp. Blastoise]